jgi:hypothetical protein
MEVLGEEEVREGSALVVMTGVDSMSVTSVGAASTTAGSGIVSMT